MTKKQLKYENPRKFLCRIDDDLWQELYNRAEKHNITMTALINFVLKIYTASRESDETTAVYGAEIHERSKNE